MWAPIFQRVEHQHRSEYALASAVRQHPESGQRRHHGGDDQTRPDGLAAHISNILDAYVRGDELTMLVIEPLMIGWAPADEDEKPPTPAGVACTGSDCFWLK